MKHYIIRTKIAAVMLAAAVVLSGCLPVPGRGGNSSGGLVFGNRDHSDKYGSAEEYCEYWYGPCEETDERDSNKTIIHEMRDNELGFTYTVYEMDVSSGSGSHTMYNSEDFGHYYLKAFLEKTDVVSSLEKMDKGLSVRVKELNISKDTGLVINYIPTVIIETDEKLTEDDAKEIVTEVREQLKSFDARGYFTKSVKTSSAYIDLRCAPWSSDAGKRFHSWKSIYDQDHP
ncbi:MAG: hypothetical protein J5777_02545 [Clostridiales bacterium]|nr:hypothetical protein [Clostridiales bacterium]